ncbi:MAG: PRTRC system ThiF family protein [Chitinophagaceae bacterium]|nr:PRTRC system ThiF family protein [Chitinophagaceae bacterium]
MIHYTAPYLLNPQHRITIDLIGCGGTGSQVLSNLGRMNYALVGLGHPGLQVKAWDPDVVTSSNSGRQLFSPSDLNQNKAAVLVTRVNRYYGTEWQSEPYYYSGQGEEYSNITISCVDTVAARLDIDQQLRHPVAAKTEQPFTKLYYWLDLGNLKKTGQAVLGTIGSIPQPKGQKSKATLKNVVKLFPQMKNIKDEDQGPSCSLAEALQGQDLFINSTLAQFGCDLLWKLIREGSIRYHGCYVNLETMTVNPIKI